MRVQVFQSVDNLERIALDLEFVQPLPPLEQFVHALVVAELEQNVDVLGVLEEVVELGDVLVLHRSVDLDFTHQLLLGPAALERGLLDYFCRRHVVVVALHELVALREASLAQEFSLHVLAVAYFSVRVLHALLHNRRTLAGRGCVLGCPVIGGQKLIRVHSSPSARR